MHQIPDWIKDFLDIEVASDREALASAGGMVTFGDLLEKPLGDEQRAQAEELLDFYIRRFVVRIIELREEAHRKQLLLAQAVGAHLEDEIGPGADQTLGCQEAAIRTFRSLQGEKPVVSPMVREELQRKRIVSTPMSRSARSRGQHQRITRAGRRGRRRGSRRLSRSMSAGSDDPGGDGEPDGLGRLSLRSSLTEER